MKAAYRSVFNSMPSTPTQDYSPTDFLLSGARIWADFVTDGVSGSSAEVNGGVTTGKCSLDFFRGGSKVKVNIGSHRSWPMLI